MLLWSGGVVGELRLVGGEKVINGVITVNTVEQPLLHTGGGEGGARTEQSRADFISECETQLFSRSSVLRRDFYSGLIVPPSQTGEISR